MNIEKTAIKLRGFGSMDKKRIREVASLGGLTAHRNGTAHEWNADGARAAGIKGRETIKKRMVRKLNGNIVVLPSPTVVISGGVEAGNLKNGPSIPGEGSV